MRTGGAEKLDKGAIAPLCAAAAASTTYTISSTTLLQGGLGA